jgi:hypothetical protein
MLFDTIVRNDTSPAPNAEPEFGYLNRSARPAASTIRDILELWFSHYPPVAHEDLRQRFRSPIDVQHRAAFFELFLHEVLFRLGYEMELHPKLRDDADKRPDFVITSPYRSRFYLEAILATEESIAETGAQARMKSVLDAINNTLDSPNFFINMKQRGTPRTQPSVKKIVTFLEEQLRKIDPDEMVELLAQAGTFQALPHWRYEHEGWEIEFFPIPKSPQARGKSGVRPIGFQFHGFQKSNTSNAIKGAIVKKAGRYGELALPYVVAVNALGFADHSDVMDALFGQEQLTLTYALDNPGEIIDTEMTRAPDGAWVSKSRPRYTRVSAVLIGFRISPWGLPQSAIRLYQNPWAKKPLARELIEVSQAVPESGEMKLIEGVSINKVLDLPQAWPTD